MFKTTTNDTRGNAKVILPLLLLIMLLAACNQQVSEPTRHYTVSGTAEGSTNGDTVYLCRVEGMLDMIPTDTTVVSGGKFFFEGETDGAQLRFVVATHRGETTAMSVIVLEAADISMKLTRQGIGDKIDGGPSQKLFEEYIDGDNRIAQQLQVAIDLINDSASTEQVMLDAELTIDSLQEERMDYKKRFITSHIPSAFSDMLFGLCEPELSADDRREMLRLLGELQPQYPAYQAAMERDKQNKKK